METKKYPVERIREVFTPPEKLQGRGGVVRLQKRGDGAYDLLVGVLYWATDTGKQKELNANKALTRWAAEVTERVPTRTMVFWMMDANAKLGYRKGEQGPELPLGSGSVGCAGPEVESVNGKMLREWLTTQHLAAVNTHEVQEGWRGKSAPKGWDTGATFRRWDGAKSRIDYLAVPTGVLGEVERVEILDLSAHKLQLANCAQLRDHQPLRMMIPYKLWYEERCDEKNKNHIDLEDDEGVGDGEQTT